jgi:hypothetical protein
MVFRDGARRFLQASALLFGGLGALGAPGADLALAGEAASPGVPRVDTRIEAAYGEVERRLDGTVTQVWTNSTPDTVPDLWFHLYWNAFANNRSTFLTESQGKLRQHPMLAGTAQDSEWGWQRIVSVLVEGEERIGTLRYRRPEGGSPEDLSVFSVDLATPLAPGATVNVTVKWESQVPRVRRRTGHKDDFLMIAHWFPKLGVYQAGRGWNCHEFHMHTEFFGNWGTYDVELALPARYDGRVFSSGTMNTPSERRGERVIVRFQAPSAAERARMDPAPGAGGRQLLVHDFVWAADPDVKPRRATFHYDEWRRRYPEEVARVQAALGPERDIGLSDVEITVLMQPEREHLWQRHFEAASTALFFYGLRVGTYPFDRLTVLDPPHGGGEAGGMEYPLLFTCGSNLFTDERLLDFEPTVIHECGHQFFHGILANNEFEEAWLDEGLNSWADSEAQMMRYGRRRESTAYSGLRFPAVSPFPVTSDSLLGGLLGARAIGVPFVDFRFEPLRDSGFVDFWRDQPALTFVRTHTDPRWSDRNRYVAEPPIEALGASWNYRSRESYRANSYFKPAVMLRSLPAVLGQDGEARFLRGLRRYADAMRFQHATGADFEREFSAGAEADLGWYFDALLRGTGTVDWAVTVSERPAPRPIGFFQPAPGAAFEHRDGSRDPAAAGEFELDVLVTRQGSLCLPVDVRWTFEDGSSETVRWTREEQEASPWKRFVRTHPLKCTRVAVDPDHGYFLDQDLSNNRWYAERDRVAPWRWAERAFSRAVHALHFQGGLGG